MLLGLGCVKVLEWLGYLNFELYDVYVVFFGVLLDVVVKEKVYVEIDCLFSYMDK